MDKCNDFKQLEEYLNKNYGITMTYKVKQLHFKSVKNTINGIAYVIDQMPKLKGYITELDTWHNHNWNVSASFDGTVYFSMSKFNRIMPVKVKKLNRQINGKWDHPVNTDFASLGAHEAGHILVKLDVLRRYPDKNKSQQYNLWAGSTVANEIIKNIYKDYNGRKSLLKLKKEVCEYALENNSECIAECISDYITNGSKAAELSQMVWQYFYKLYGRDDNESN